jgi:hypothetical protein
VRSPPEVLVAEGGETGADLARIVVEEPCPDHLEELGAEGSIHEAE